VDPQEESVPSAPLTPSDAPSDAAHDETAEERAKRQRKHTRAAVEWVAVIALALIVAVVLRTFVVQTFWIPSGSMESTLLKNDRVVVNKLSYRLHKVHRGDVVVFTTPLDVPPGYTPVQPGYKDLVKRVIGLPGDTVEGRGGRVFVNGEPLREDYVKEGETTSSFGPVHVPPGSYWVMGDNRGNSEDSRFFGPIPKHTIVGRAFIRIWPLNRIGLL
jgi:signal peptidase I